MRTVAIGLGLLGLVAACWCAILIVRGAGGDACPDRDPGNGVYVPGLTELARPADPCVAAARRADAAHGRRVIATGGVAALSLIIAAPLLLLGDRRRTGGPLPADHGLPR